MNRHPHHPLALSRRGLLRLGGGGLALGTASATGLLVPRRLGAAPAADERLFIFVLCDGGWDPTFIFQPAFDRLYMDAEDDAEVATAGGMTFVDSEERPAVRDFFESWGDKAAVLNGFEVESITHERCMRQLLTGSGADGGDDWGAHIAARSASNRPVGYGVLSGVAITAEHTSRVVRVGPTNQLSDLLDGSALLDHSEQSVSLPSDDTADLVEAMLEQRLAAFGERSPRGRAQRYAETYARVIEEARGLAAAADDLSLGGGSSGTGLDQYGDMAIGLDLLEQGLSRAVMVGYYGQWSQGWDTHAENSKQSTHFELLFQHLDQLMADLALRAGPGGGSLLDQTTVVVLSEMGRGPTLNAFGGKDHFTFTSAMLLGSGVRGGMVVGDCDDWGIGLPVDLASGEVSEAGTDLKARHLGATVLALADVDPAEILGGEVEPVRALIDV